MEVRSGAAARMRPSRYVRRQRVGKLRDSEVVVESKRLGSGHFLRLVENDQEPKHGGGDLALEADRIEARIGTNPYSSFLRKHGHRPERNQAATIGRIMGGRVRASDGSMQPILTRGERDAIKAIKSRRREWSQKIDSVYRTVAAIDSIAKNELDPATIAVCGKNEFSNAETREKLAMAIRWLTRLSQEIIANEETGSRTQVAQCNCGPSTSIT
jgi:hypothetical protein